MGRPKFIFGDTFFSFVPVTDGGSRTCSVLPLISNMNFIFVAAFLPDSIIHDTYIVDFIALATSLTHFYFGCYFHHV